MSCCIPTGKITLRTAWDAAWRHVWSDPTPRPTDWPCRRTLPGYWPPIGAGCSTNRRSSRCLHELWSRRKFASRSRLPDSTSGTCSVRSASSRRGTWAGRCAATCSILAPMSQPSPPATALLDWGLVRLDRKWSRERNWWLRRRRGFPSRLWRPFRAPSCRPRFLTSSRGWRLANGCSFTPAPAE